jgi:hypothetical protein
MAHQEEITSMLSHEDYKYQEHTRRAADFKKIDLFRSAREEYKLALNYYPGDPVATTGIDECNSYIKRDRRKVLFIVPFVLALIAVVIYLNM